MKWELKEIETGDMVRIPMSDLYHYGVCTDENRIIQFGEPVIGNPKKAEDIKVMAVTIEEFLKGAFAEVAVFDKKEQKSKRKLDDIIRYAEEAVGNGGYDILYNNCEHFANECIFGKHKSSHVDDVRKEIEKKIPTINVYVGNVDDFKNAKKLPPYVKKQMKEIKNSRVADEKTAGFGLLAYAAQKCGIKPNIKKCCISETGKPVHNDYFFSISHSVGVVAVAFSTNGSVGVDVEEAVSAQRSEKLAGKILCAGEKCDNLPALWTVKEAVFKFKGEKKVFTPNEIDIKAVKNKSVSFDMGGKKYILSVAGDAAVKINYFTAPDGESLSVSVIDV